MSPHDRKDGGVVALFASYLGLGVKIGRVSGQFQFDSSGFYSNNSYRNTTKSSPATDHSLRPRLHDLLPAAVVKEPRLPLVVVA